MTCPNCPAENEELSVVRTIRNRTIDGKFSAFTDVRQMLCNPAKGGCGHVFYTETKISDKPTLKSEQFNLF